MSRFILVAGAYVTFDRYDGDGVVVALETSGKLCRDGSGTSGCTTTRKLEGVDAAIARVGREHVQRRGGQATRGCADANIESRSREWCL